MSPAIVRCSAVFCHRPVSRLCLPGRLGYWVHLTEIFVYAKAHELTILTKNPRDFRQLHLADTDHAGILLVYVDNDPTRDMSDADVVRAIGNLVASGVPLAG